MSRFEHVDAIARALLYEGYVLYPYRGSSLKNQRRFPFGVLAPRAFAEAVGGSERWRCRTECLLMGPPSFSIEVRFLHPTARTGEAIERRIGIDAPGTRRERFAPEPEAGCVEVGAEVHVELERLERRLSRVSVEIRNTTVMELDPDAARGRPAPEAREEAALRSMASTHALLGAREGELVSLLEPPPALAGHAAECRNEGTFPVLVGPLERRDTMLASPILVYDHPRIAPESPGDFFDGTEIDELLALRVLTLTDAEKDEIRRSDPAAAEVLARVEALGPSELASLHGRLALRKPTAVGGLVAGDRVRLAPAGRSDVMDLALRGRVATVASVEQDVDGTMLLAVTVDDDPGADLGLAGWPGHRFFFRPEEVERIG